MKRAAAALTVCVMLLPAAAQARDFTDLRTDLAAAPYRAAAAFAGFHPLAALDAALRNGMAAWDEGAQRAEDLLVIGWGRLALGAEEVRASADRGLVAFLGRLFAAPVPHAAVPAAIGTAAPPPPDPAGDAWVDDVERLFR